MIWYDIDTLRCSIGLECVKKYLFPGAKHDVFRHGVDFRLHVELVGAKMDDQDSEIGAPQIQGQELSFFCKQDNIMYNNKRDMRSKV